MPDMLRLALSHGQPPIFYQTGKIERRLDFKSKLSDG